MKTALVALLFASAALAQEPFPEFPSGPVEWPKARTIFDQQWRIIEPELFTPAGTKHIGRRVYFESSPVSLGRPLVVRTGAGTTARVTHVPKTDMDLIRSFRKPPSNIAVHGTLVAIDPVKRHITVKGGGANPSK